MAIFFYGKAAPKLLKEQQREWNSIPDPELDRLFNEYERQENARQANARRKKRDYEHAEKTRRHDPRPGAPIKRDGE